MIFYSQISKLQGDLNEYKDKWASAQCDLLDSQEKLNETEKERDKALTILKGTLDKLKEETEKVFELEAQIADTSAFGVNKTVNE